jgi:hypothetical protein
VLMKSVPHVQRIQAEDPARVLPSPGAGVQSRLGLPHQTGSDLYTGQRSKIKRCYLTYSASASLPGSFGTRSLVAPSSSILEVVGTLILALT